MELVFIIAAGIVLAYVIITNIALIGWVILGLIFIWIVYKIIKTFFYTGEKVLEALSLPLSEKKNPSKIIQKIITIFDIFFYPLIVLFSFAEKYKKRYGYISYLIDFVTIILMFIIFGMYFFIFLFITDVFINL